MSTSLRLLGADILTYPSAFTDKTGEAHWEPLLRARAIETQCYVVAAAQAGPHHAGRISHGRAMIVGPWGNIEAELPSYCPGYVEEGCVAAARIDLGLVEKSRCSMPVFSHRRPDIYARDMMFANKTIPSATIFYRTALSFAFTNIR